MNAESTVFRATRPAVVVAPGGEGARAAVSLLAWPMRLAASALGRRLLAAVALGVMLVATVGYLYTSADPVRPAGTFRPAGLAVEARAAPAASGRQAAAAPARKGPAPGPADVAAAWWAARQKVAVDRVRPLQQRRISATETQVLVVAEAAGSRMPSGFVTVRKGPSGWKVP
jgi:hypothetical protein